MSANRAKIDQSYEKLLDELPATKQLPTNSLNNERVIRRTITSESPSSVKRTSALVFKLEYDKPIPPYTYYQPTRSYTYQKGKSDTFYVHPP